MKKQIRNWWIRAISIVAVVTLITVTLMGLSLRVSVVASKGTVSISFAQQQAYARTMNPYLPVINSQINTISRAGNKYEIVTGKGSKIIIGDSSSPQFKPTVEFQHFANEAGIKLALDGITGNLNPQLLNNILTAGNNNFGFTWQGTTPNDWILDKDGELYSPYNENGGLDWLITLKKQPPISSLSFTYNSSLVTAYLQPPLTAEFTVGQDLGGGLTVASVTASIVLDSSGEVYAERPPPIVNSIAFYRTDVVPFYSSEALADKYKTGKVGHLYSMDVVDANGIHSRAEWNIVDSDTISLSVPQSYLSSAKYPVTITPFGDTFGDTSTSASTVTVEGNIRGHIFTGAAGTGVSTSAYVRTTTADKLMKGGLYDEVDPNSNLITNGGTGENTVVTNGAHWEAFAFSSAPALSATSYRIIIWGASGTGTGVVYYDSGSRVRDNTTVTYGTYPTNVDWGQVINQNLSLYCTYTPSANPEITVSPTSYGFGIVDVSSTSNTTTSYFTIDNTSTMQTDQTISVTTTTWSGGVTWTHSDTATAGANTAGLKANKGGTWGTGDVIVKNASPNFIAENQAASTDYSFGLSLITPTSHSDGVQKTIVVRITATSG